MNKSMKQLRERTRAVEYRRSLMFIRQSGLLAFLCIALALLGGCSQKAKSAETPLLQPPIDTAIDAQLLNDAARFLAGMPGRPQSAYHELESTPAWSAHASAFDKAWANAETRQFARV